MRVARHLRTAGALAVIGATCAASPPPSTHHWRALDGGFQIEEGLEEPLDVTDAREATRGACPAGMVSVQGSMRRDAGATVDALQRATCVDWIDPRFPERCARFDRDAWLAIANGLPAVPMSFCIDRFEHPNRRGAFPGVFVTWSGAAAVCARERKRLCTEDEWTFACEGEEAEPYPYGYERDAQTCVIDRPHVPPDDRRLALGPDEAVREIDRLWQGEPSGARPRCRSPFGVYDMTGNVDEWTRSNRPDDEHPSILEGGYWGPVRTRCRPSTRAHGEAYAYYQQGFRCCADSR
jgi:hypothetical protein